MNRFAEQSALPFQPRDEALSATEARQVQTCRLISLLGAFLLKGVGLLRLAVSPNAHDPIWACFAGAALLAVFFAATYLSQSLRRHCMTWMRGGLYVVMVWAVSVVIFNHATEEYVLGLLVLYAGLIGGVGLSGRSAAGGWWFAAFGFLITAVGLVFGPPSRMHPLAVLASMAAAALLVGVATQAHLSIQGYLRERRSQWQHLVENLQEAVMITVEGEVAYANGQAASLFGASSAEALHGCSAFDLVPPEAHEEMQEQLGATEKGQSTAPQEHRVTRSDGEERIVQSQSVSVQYEEEDAALTVLRDVTHWYEARDTLRRRAELEHLIVEISAGFIDTPIHRLDRAIEEALGTVGSFVGADRSYVFLFDGNPMEEGLDEVTQSNTHEWCAGGITPQKDNLQNIPCASIPWWMEQIQNREPVIVPSVADLPEAAAAVQEILEAQHIQSLVSLPMIRGERLVGFVGFDAVKETVDWDEETVTVLRVLEDAIASALQRKEMGEQIREREERLRAITENVSEGIYRSTPDEGLVYATQSFAEMFGYDRAEDVFEIDPSTLYSTPEARDRLREAAQEQDSFEGVEAKFQRADGTTFVGLVSGSIVRDEDGAVEYYDGAITDITERKEAEQAMREERDRFETLFESLPTPVVRCTANEEGILIADVNDAFETVFGVTRAEAENESLDALLMPEGTGGVGIDRRALTQGAVRADVRCEAADGLRDFRIQVAGRNPDTGPPEGHAIYTDITARKRRERALKETNATLEAILENLPSGILAEDGSRSVLAANESFCNVLGLPMEAAELRGRDAETVLEKTAEFFADPEAFAVRTREILDRGEPVFDEELWLADGGVLERDFVPYVLADGTAALWVYRDVSERKQHERRLRDAKDEAEEANRMKSVFLANMSHEIRTPLTSMIGFAEVISDEVEGEEEGPIPRFATLIEESGHRLLETLDSILNLSKLEAGEMELSPEPVPITEELKETVELFGPQAEEAGIDLQVHTPARSLCSHADPGGLRIVLRNLISNALKYTEEGSVWVRAEQRNGTVAIEVEDTGIGMDSEKTSALFEAFRQESEGIAREYEGSGLGLAVTKRVVDQMDGTIEVETEKGQGTCFTVQLPVR